MKIGRLAAPLLAALLAVAGCTSETGDRRARAEVVVGARSDAESSLLAGVYVAALRS